MQNKILTYVANYEEDGWNSKEKAKINFLKALKIIGPTQN